MAFLSSSCESICTCDMHSCLLQVACFFCYFGHLKPNTCYIPLLGLISYISITRGSIL
jgi:hypothetical protein